MHIVVVAHSLSREARTHHLHNNFLLLLQKPLFRRKKRASLHLSLSLSLFWGQKQSEKDIEKAYLFPSLPPEKIKKTEGSTQKKRKTKFFQHRLHGPKFSSDDDDARKQKRSPPLLTNNANVAWTSNSRRNNQTYFIVTTRAEERACGRDVGQTERVFRTREKEQISPFEIFSLSPSVFGHERASFAPKIPVRKALSFKR